MSIKSRLIRCLLKWMWKRYPFQYKDILKAEKLHIHRDPKRKTLPNPAVSGVDE